MVKRNWWSAASWSEASETSADDWAFLNSRL